MQNPYLAEQLQNRLVNMLRAEGALKTKPLIDAFRSVPRHWFVDRYLDVWGKRRRLVNVDPDRPSPAQLARIYFNDALVSHIKPPSSTSQPALVARMLDGLRVKPGMSVLEVGAGTGWNAALLGKLVGPEGRVHTIEIQADVATRARRHLARAAARNVTVVRGDGGKGYPGAGPYDRIIATASCPEVPPDWMAQLKPKGVIVIALKDFPETESCCVVRFTPFKGRLLGDVLQTAGFMSLRGPSGAGYDWAATKQRLARMKEGKRLRRKPSIWSGWNWSRISDLMLFAHLEGLSIFSMGQAFVLQVNGSDSFCITQGDEIEVYGGEESYRRFCEIADKWFDMGSPKKEVYRVEAWPKGLKRTANIRKGWISERKHSYLHFRLKDHR